MTPPDARPDPRRLSRRAAVVAAVEEAAPVILGHLDALHADPELSGEERRAAARLTASLETEGFEVRRGLAGLDTAFQATRRLGPGPAVAFLAEYDALPGLGHGCGHNLIAAAAIGAGLAAVRAAGAGEIRVIGTPAEETVGGKIVLAESGMFDGIDAALMVHPGNEDRVFTDSLACHSVQIEFQGRAAHAVAHPEKGINALDALVQLYMAAAQIQKSSPRDVHLPGVLTEGGVRANVVPERAVGQWTVRAPDAAIRNRTVGRLRAAAEGIAAATGCTVRIVSLDNPYEAMRTNHTIAARAREHFAAEGVATADAPRENKGSLDMGNVSVRTPSLHAYVRIAPPEVPSHSAAFAAASVSGAGRAAALLAARVLAATASDFIAEQDLADSARAEFAAARAGAGPAGTPPVETPLLRARPV